MKAVTELNSIKLYNPELFEKWHPMSKGSLYPQIFKKESTMNIQIFGTNNA